VGFRIGADASGAALEDFFSAETGGSLPSEKTTS